jgi:hypothetical protein
MTIRCSLGHDNPDGSAFCDECGEPLASAAPASTITPAPAPVAPAPAPAGSQACPSCGSINAAGEAFCSNCGSMLGAPAPAVANIAPAAVPVAAVAVTTLTARLVVEADNQEFDLSGKDNIVLGREDAVSNIYPDVDLTPHGGEEGGVSRLHARIFYESGQYMLEDENSTNFTYLNRQKLAGKTPTPLHDNDEVRLGRVLLRFKES